MQGRRQDGVVHWFSGTDAVFQDALNTYSAPTSHLHCARSLAKAERQHPSTSQLVHTLPGAHGWPRHRNWASTPSSLSQAVSWCTDGASSWLLRLGAILLHFGECSVTETSICMLKIPLNIALCSVCCRLCTKEQTLAGNCMPSICELGHLAGAVSRSLRGSDWIFLSSSSTGAANAIHRPQFGSLVSSVDRCSHIAVHETSMHVEHTMVHGRSVGMPFGVSQVP